MVAPNDSSAESPSPKRAVSPRKRRANRRNAQQSTGPRTTEGKAVSSRNATTHGIFCRDLVLPGESFELFEVIRDGFVDALKPQDAAQLAVVDIAVSARWRLNRCQFAEATLIERRIAAAAKGVNEQFESLGRNIRYEDFSAAAIDAQCAQSEVFRRHFQQWKQLRDARDRAVHPGHALAALMYNTRDGEQPLDRLSRYEHRLEQSFHRCLRDLHVLKQRAKEYADEPPSPFRTRYGVEDDENHTPSPLAGEGGGEGERCGVDDARSAESSNADPRNKPASLHTVPPHPNPLPQGERGPETEPPVQNEPTAQTTAASPAPADGCSAPDPQEMAALRKFTDQLSRCRPRDDAQESDDDYKDDLMT
jgi:hypothetical protein